MSCLDLNERAKLLHDRSIKNILSKIDCHFDMVYYLKFFNFIYDV